MYKKYNNVERVKPSGLELKDHLVGVQRVTKVTKGGRTFSFSAIVVVGNGDGVVGHGLGKSQDVASSIAKAIEDAKTLEKLNLKPDRHHLLQTQLISLRYFQEICEESDKTIHELTFEDLIKRESEHFENTHKT